MQNYNPYSYPTINTYPYNYMLDARQRLSQMELQYPQFAQQNQYMQTQQAQPIGIQGKIVSDFETVRSTEIPLDGSISYFPTTNREYVYAKFLNMNTGSSDYEVYKRVSETQQEQKQEEFDIKAYLDEKFESLKQELKGGMKDARKSSNRADIIKADE